jgi:hypothetical protein
LTRGAVVWYHSKPTEVQVAMTSNDSMGGAARAGDRMDDGFVLVESGASAAAVAEDGDVHAASPLRADRKSEFDS